MSYSQNIENCTIIFNEEKDYLDIRKEYLMLHIYLGSCVSDITFLEFLQFNLPENKNFEINKMEVNQESPSNDIINPAYEDQLSWSGTTWNYQDSVGNFVQVQPPGGIYFESPIHESPIQSSCSAFSDSSGLSDASEND